MLLKVCQIVAGIIIGCVYFYLWSITTPNFFFRAPGLDWIIHLSIPLLASIAAYSFRRIRWALLSFSLTVFLIIGLLYYAAANMNI
jgi:hypothetical protein